jgi:transcriptional regulator with XRE-family HTH domain
MNYKRKFGETVRRKRLEAGLSQMELGNRADLDRVGIWEIEHGNRQPMLLTVLKLAGALETTASDLCEGLSLQDPVAAGSPGKFAAG